MAVDDKHIRARIGEDLHRDVRLAAALQGVSITTYLVRVLTKATQKDLAKVNLKDE